MYLEGRTGKVAGSPGEGFGKCSPGKCISLGTLKVSSAGELGDSACR